MALMNKIEKLQEDFKESNMTAGGITVCAMVSAGSGALAAIAIDDEFKDEAIQAAAQEHVSFAKKNGFSVTLEDVTETMKAQKQPGEGLSGTATVLGGIVMVGVMLTAVNAYNKFTKSVIPSLK